MPRIGQEDDERPVTYSIRMITEEMERLGNEKCGSEDKCVSESTTDGDSVTEVRSTPTPSTSDSGHVSVEDGSERAESIDGGEPGEDRPKRKMIAQAAVRYHTQLQFHERLQYIDQRYDHLRKMTLKLKKKVAELEDVMRGDETDAHNAALITRIMDDIKAERAAIRDEAHVIRGELAQATYNESARKHLSGEARKQMEREIEARRKLLETSF